MSLEICAVGGYGVVGRNMTAVRFGEKVVILDMGIHLPNFIKINDQNAAQASEDLKSTITRKTLLAEKVIPDDSVIEPWRKNVVAIIPTHAHLDHIGAIPFMAQRYDTAPLVTTPFTAEVLRAMLSDEKIRLPNPIKVLSPNDRIKLTDDISVEFVSMTHSTPQTVMVVLRSSHGNLVYLNDFKLDNHPTLGRKPDYDKLAALGKEGVTVAIVDSLYANNAAKTPSEMVARDMLFDVLLNRDMTGKGLIVTTFASHIARLKSIIEVGEKLNRKIVFLGRSLSKYCFAAENAGLVRFSNTVTLVRYKKQAQQILKRIQREGKNKYMLVVTGHQGEPGSALWKMIQGTYPYHFDSHDHVVFSSNVIPTPINEKNRAEIEEKLKGKAVRIFRDVHVSGHGSREDMRQLMELLKPRHLIPAHSPYDRIESYIELAEEMGYKNAHTVHGLLEGQRIVLK